MEKHDHQKHTPYFSPYLDGIVLVCATVKAIIVWLLSRNGINMRGDWSPEDRTGRGDSRDGAGRVGYAFDFHGPPMRCGVYLMKLIQSMLQRAETIFFLTSWMVGRHIPSSGGNCLPQLLKTLSAFPICDFYSNLDQHTIHYRNSSFLLYENR